MYARYLKRLTDIVCALFFFATFWWVYIVVAVLVFKKLGSPIIFKQQRPGKDGQIFTIYKFRSMTAERDTSGNLLSDDLRLTAFGKWLRSTSIDEFPQFWNILIGDMSLIGPRPQLLEYLSLYSQDQLRRHLVRPGITGWAQVNGRNAISWEKRLQYDVWYVENITLLLDIKIFFLTVMHVLKKDGISAEHEATMPRFEGSKPQT